jgi:xanthine dehydrogenase accessory factor
MDPLVLRKLNAERRARRAAIRVTDVADGRDRVVLEGDKVAGELGQAIGMAFRSGRSGLVEADGHEWFLNVHLPPPRLVIIGAVHISQALAPMGTIAGFHVTIIDPRTAFASAERLSGARLIADWPETVLKHEPLDPYSALVAVTHDPKIDDPAIEAALKAGCFYIGALGSRKTHGRRLERLHAAGLTPSETGRIEAPIGLDIGAASPAEIAVAILASVIASLRRRELAERTGEAVPT